MSDDSIWFEADLQSHNAMVSNMDKSINVILQIAHRASKLYAEHDVDAPVSHIAAEIMFVHDHVVPLRLNELLAARDGDFAHDVTGIHRHLDIDAGKLRDCFMPRFADTSDRKETVTP